MTEKKVNQLYRYYHKKYLGQKVVFIIREILDFDKTKLHRFIGTLQAINIDGSWRDDDDNDYYYLLAVVKPDIWPDYLDYEYFNEIELKDIKLIK
jgi:hypothetical protein